MITSAEETITDPANEQAIKDTLIEACKLLFNDQQEADCINTVNVNFPGVIDSVINEFNPQEICDLLQACP